MMGLVIIHYLIHFSSSKLHVIIMLALAIELEIHIKIFIIIEI